MAENKSLTPPDFSRCHVLVVGDVMLDVYFIGRVRRISPEAPVPVVHVRQKSDTLGGAGNTALNLSGLGCQTTLIGICGRDEAGRRLKGIMAHKNINDKLIAVADHPTTTKTRVIGQGQQLLRLDEEKFLAAADTWHAQMLQQVAQSLPSAQAVILSDYGKGVLSDDFCQAIIAKCRQNSLPVIIDPKGQNWKKYQGATCITPNTAEVALAAGISQADDQGQLVAAAQTLRRRHRLKWLLATRGALGMCLIDAKNRASLIPATAREVYDVSGAGDTVIATLAACVAAGVDFKTAATMANVAAGIVVAKLGSQAVSLAELKAALHANLAGSGKIVTFDAAQIQVKAWQAGGQKVVFTNGCFDLLHPGHIHILNQSRQAGNRLVVGLNTDASIRAIKGPTRPIVGEQARADVLSALSCVDMVILFNDDTPLNLITGLKPDVLAKGADYTVDQVVGHEVVESYGGKVLLIPLLKGHSTTQIVNRVNQRN